MPSVTVSQAECHETCLNVVGAPTGHTANVNPVGDGSPNWRVDCESCSTCVTASCKTKAEARDAAVTHVMYENHRPD